MRAIGRLHSVVVVEVERVPRGIDDSHCLAEGVVHVEDVAALGAHPGRLQGVVVRIKLIRRQAEIGEASRGRKLFAVRLLGSTPPFFDDSITPTGTRLMLLPAPDEY